MLHLRPETFEIKALNVRHVYRFFDRIIVFVTLIKETIGDIVHVETIPIDIVQVFIECPQRTDGKHHHHIIEADEHFLVKFERERRQTQELVHAIEEEQE